MRNESSEGFLYPFLWGWGLLAPIDATAFIIQDMHFSQ